MNIVNFTPVSSFTGGLLIGIASLLLMYYNGKISGISGIGKSLILNIQLKEKLWRIYFISGLLIGGLIISLAIPEATARINDINIYQAVIGGLLVGIGTSLGNGCTSGHGVCGLARRSRRSMIATGSFMFSGFVTVYLLLHLLGL